MGERDVVDGLLNRAKWSDRESRFVMDELDQEAVYEIQRLRDRWNSRSEQDAFNSHEAGYQCGWAAATRANRGREG